MKPLGQTGLAVTPLCLGCSGLGSMPEIFGYEVPFERAVATVSRMLAGPINFLDTSADYSDGESERRIGAALRDRGGLPDGVVLATKAFAGSDVRRSAEESLLRLGIDKFQLLHLHDPELIGFEAAMAPGGPVEELVRLRDEGIAEHIGVAGGPIDMLIEFVRTDLFEVVLTHNRYTLVDRSAEPLLDEANRSSVGVVNAAVFGGGMLAKGPDHVSTYRYEPAGDELVERVRVIERLCERHGVPLGAVALQFSLHEARIASTVVGVSRPERIDQLLAWAARPIPDELWEKL